MKDVQKLIGRKLSLKEKVAFVAFKQLHKKLVRSAPKDPAQTAFTLGLIGLLVLIVPILNLASLPLAIIAISMGSRVKREDPGK